ncbi:MAG: DUF5666 domain-containing protein, partial [Dehalococcoidales bacterium]|nr:DUF5666 domain-containing protein [Dehalococcoidales bacterium]
MSFRKIITVLVVLAVVAVGSIAALQAQRAQASELNGTIESVSNSGVIMNGKIVAINGATNVEGTLVPGAAVTITAKVQPDGSLVAVKISARDGRNGGENEDKGKGGKGDGNGNGNGNGGARGNSGVNSSSRGESEGGNGNRASGQSRQ